MNTEAPLYWLEQIKTEITNCKKIPLWGNSPCFPWEELSIKMQEILECPTFRIYPTSYEPIPLEGPLAPFGLTPQIVSFQLAPLEGTLTWAISAESLAEITKLLLYKGNHKGLLDPDFEKGFYQFLLLEASKQIEDLKTYPDLHIQWIEKEPPKPSVFFIDISLSLENKIFPARLLFSEEFQKAFSSHFLKASFNPATSAVATKMDVLLKLEAGSCLISSKEWATIQEGDFLILDRCTYDPETKKGTLDLTWDKTTLFKIKIKKTNLKILDYAVYNGDVLTMEEDESFTDEKMQDDKEHLWEAPLEEDLLEETQEEDLIENPEQEQLPLPETAPDILASTKDIPFQIVVEVDRLKMSLEKLLQLQPGNILELPTHPERGVTLTVQGKKIARGELLKLGDILGVKIVEIGGHNQS